jgi:ubiquinone biosynthesis protein UbiJ
VSLLLTGLTAVLQTAVNQFIALDQNAKSQFQELAGKVMAIEFTDLPFKLYFIPTRDEVQVFSQYDGAIDTRLRGSSIQVLAMGASARPGDKLFKREVRIDGDTELGQRFQDILRNMDIDWEERFSLFMGDVAAHKLGNVARGLFQWGRQGLASLQDNISEYIHYESNSLPTRFEVNTFIGEVDNLRDDIERLNARVQRLCSAPTTSPSGPSTPNAPPGSKAPLKSKAPRSRTKKAGDQ